ncbi:hypothetical protein ACF07Q_03845 [Nocardiopsis dassonvillei]|uniref:hypothetical protein n=1 Tax=Nocardiopsis dassonvillei TaxID=2014 RepID=UPI0036F6C7F8
MTTTALNYRDGTWEPGPDPVNEACATQTVEEDWTDCVARAGFNRRPFAEYGGPCSSSYAQLFSGADGTSFFMHIAHGGFGQHLYFHSVVDALDHAARWAPAFALQNDDPELASSEVGAAPAVPGFSEDFDEEELAKLRRSPHP